MPVAERTVRHWTGGWKIHPAMAERIRSQEAPVAPGGKRAFSPTFALPLFETLKNNRLVPAAVLPWTIAGRARKGVRNLFGEKKVPDAFSGRLTPPVGPKRARKVGYRKMGANSSLLLLARDVRSRTLRLLDTAHPGELTWVPPGTSNHLLWHAGHALWLQDVLFLRLLSGRNGLPTGWEELFRMGSRPGRTGNPSWPAAEDLRRELAAQLRRLVDAIEPLTAAQWDARPPYAHRDDERTLRQGLAHSLHDEACHQGEMYLLLKMQRLGPSGSGATP